MKYFIPAIFSCLLFFGSAMAWGPATHIGQGLAFLQSLHQNPLSGPKGDVDLYEDPDNLMYLELGATWPDIGRILPNVWFEPHTREFLWFLFEEGINSGDPRFQSFGFGNLMHGAGDLVSQISMTNWMAVRGAFGEMNVVIGLKNEVPGHENEAVVEGLGELHWADFSLYLELCQYFFADNRLSEVLDWYLQEATNFFGPPSDYVQFEKPDVASIISNMKKPSSWNTLTYGNNKSGQISINWFELERLANTPLFKDPEFWDVYWDDILPVAVYVIRVIEPGEHYYSDWPNWSVKPMTTSAAQSLAYYRQDIYDWYPDVLVYDAGWTDDIGTPITSIDADNPPAGVTLWVELMAAVPVDTPFGIRIRKDAPSFEYLKDSIVALENFQFVSSPYDYSENPRPIVSITFDVAGHLENSQGFIFELLRNSDPLGKAFFTSDWKFLHEIDSIDFDQDAYVGNHGTYKFPTSLQIENPHLNIPWGMLEGRVKCQSGPTGYISGAIVQLADSGIINATTNKAGYFRLDRIPLGMHTIWIRANGYLDWMNTVNIEEGKTYTINAMLTPKF